MVTEKTITKDLGTLWNYESTGDYYHHCLKLSNILLSYTTENLIDVLKHLGIWDCMEPEEEKMMYEELVFDHIGWDYSKAAEKGMTPTQQKKLMQKHDEIVDLIHKRAEEAL